MNGAMTLDHMGKIHLYPSPGGVWLIKNEVKGLVSIPYSSKAEAWKAWKTGQVIWGEK